MVNAPNWISAGNSQLGLPLPGTVDTGVTRADGTVVPSIVPGTRGRFYDTGPTRLGNCGFIFLPGVTATVAGDAVTYYLSAGVDVPGDVNDGAATQRWVGTASTGRPVVFATAAADTQAKWQWYAEQGGAIINVSGTVSAGQAAYFGQTGVLQTNAAVGGKQLLGVVSSSASGVPDTGKAIFTINNPVVQSQIT